MAKRFCRARAGSGAVVTTTALHLVAKMAWASLEIYRIRSGREYGPGIAQDISSRTYKILSLNKGQAARYPLGSGYAAPGLKEIVAAPPSGRSFTTEGFGKGRRGRPMTPQKVNCGKASRRSMDEKPLVQGKAVAAPARKCQEQMASARDIRGWWGEPLGSEKYGRRSGAGHHPTPQKNGPACPKRRAPL